MPRIIIAGASSGLGLRIARICADNGWNVGVAARNDKALMALKEEFPSAVEWERIDVTDDNAPGKLETLIEAVGGMDIYLHVSGICIENPELNIKNDTNTVRTNVEGFTRMVDAAFNYFRKTGRKGQIAAITSVAGTKGLADLASYSASKRYQWAYLQALEQLAMREHIDVRFTDIRPGWTKTPLIDPSRRYLMAMEPEKVAYKAFRAIVKKQRVKVIDRKWAIMSFFWNILPNWLWKRLQIYASSSR